MELIFRWLDALDEATIHQYIKLSVLGLPFILVMGKLFFGSWGGFFDSIRYLLMPDIVSMLRGEWGEDTWASFKLLLFIALCAGALYSAHRHFFGA